MDPEDKREPDHSKCPFCGARRWYRTSKQELRWICGTTGEVGKEEFLTTDRCDKAVFREGFLASISALRKLVHAVETPRRFYTDRREEDALEASKRVIEKYGE